MAWEIGDEITAAKLNTENHVLSTSWYKDAPEADNDSHYTFDTPLLYLHDGGGTDNPIVFYWRIYVDRAKYGGWGSWYGPRMTFWVEKREEDGTVIGDRWTLRSGENISCDIINNVTIQDLKDRWTCDNASGYYYFYIDVEDDVTGSGFIDFKAYAFPCNNKVGGKLRTYQKYSSTPTSSPESPVLITTDLLNSHVVGTE